MPRLDRRVRLLLVSLLLCVARVCGVAFLTLGDWGGHDLGPDYALTVDLVAEAMADSAAALEAQFLVNVGDNFYWCGIVDVDDPQIAVDYLDVYTAPSLQIPWYSALGNHEYGERESLRVEPDSSPRTRAASRARVPRLYWSSSSDLLAPFPRTQGIT